MSPWMQYPAVPWPFLYEPSHTALAVLALIAVATLAPLSWPLVFWVTSSTAQLDVEVEDGKASSRVVGEMLLVAPWVGLLWLECEPIKTWLGWDMLKLTSAG